MKGRGETAQKKGKEREWTTPEARSLGGEENQSESVGK